MTAAPRNFPLLLSHSPTGPCSASCNLSLPFNFSTNLFFQQLLLQVGISYSMSLNLSLKLSLNIYEFKFAYLSRFGGSILPCKFSYLKFPQNSLIFSLSTSLWCKDGNDNFQSLHFGTETKSLTNLPLKVKKSLIK